LDNYNVLVLMQKDKESRMLTDTVDSYTLREGMEYVEGAYLMEDSGLYIYLTMTTGDVEDWQYYGIYDLYNEEIFEGLVADILDGSGEYNPRWILKLKYTEDRRAMEDALNQMIRLHREELQRILPILEENKQKYQNEAESED
jgi:hypothetical protein